MPLSSAKYSLQPDGLSIRNPPSQIQNPAEFHFFSLQNPAEFQI